MLDLNPSSYPGYSNAVIKSKTCEVPTIKILNFYIRSERVMESGLIKNVAGIEETTAFPRMRVKNVLQEDFPLYACLLIPIISLKFFILWEI